MAEYWGPRPCKHCKETFTPPQRGAGFKATYCQKPACLLARRRNGQTKQVNKNVKPLKEILCKNKNCKKGEGGTRKKFRQKTTRQKYCCLQCGKEDKKTNPKKKSPVIKAKKSIKKAAKCSCGNKGPLNYWGYCRRCWTLKSNQVAEGCEYG